MSYDGLNSEGKKLTPRVRWWALRPLRAHSAICLFSFSGAGFRLVTATARPLLGSSTLERGEA